MNVTPADGPMYRSYGEVKSERSKIPQLSLAAGHFGALLPQFVFFSSKRLHVAFQSRLCGCGFKEWGRIKNPQGN